MRILFIAPYTPLLTKPRPYQFILHLARQHEVYLLCVEDMPQGTPANRSDYQYLRARCRYIEHVPLSLARKVYNCALSLFTSQPMRVAYYPLEYMRQRLERLVNQYSIDVVYVDRSRLAHVARHIELPKVLDLTDSISWHLLQCLRYAPPYFKPIYLFEFLKVRRYELTVGHEYDECLITSGKDLEFFRDTSFYDRISVVPNIIGQAFWDHSPASASDANPPSSIAFCGNMYYYPNVDGLLHFYKETYPLIRRALGDVRLDIVGNRPSSAIRRLGKDPSVRVTGYVSDMADYMSSASIVISPVRIAGGFPNTVAEGLAVGKAVVSTSQGCRGLPGPKDALVIADSPGEFAERVITLIQDQEQRHHLERMAQRYARTHLCPSKVKPLLDDIFAKLG